MNRAIYVLLFLVGFLTGNYDFMIMIPVMWWVFKDEKKKIKKRVENVKTKRKKIILRPFTYSFHHNYT